MNRLLNRLSLCIVLVCLQTTFGQLLPLQGSITPENSIKEIIVQNNQFIDENLILKRISVYPGQSYHPVILKDKIKASVKSLYDTGLFSNIDVQIEYSETQNETSFIFTVEEHPQLNTYSYTGNDELSEEDIDILITLVNGQVISPSDIERTRQRIISRYKEEGFLLAEVIIRKSKDSESGKIDITFEINEGDKVVVDAIVIHGNEYVHSSDITENLASEIDNWWGEGEYKEESFEADKDSILAVYRSKGFLDAEVVKKEIVYIQDPSYRFYIGQAIKQGFTSEQLIESVLKELNNESSPFYTAARTAIIRSNHYYRHTRRSISEENQAVLMPDFETEEEIITLLNRIIMLSEVRNEFIKRVYSKGSNSEIDSLQALESTTEDQEKRIARLTLESLFPLMPYDELTTSSNLSLNFTVREGRQYYTGNFTFIGNNIYSTEVLESQLTLDTGAVFDNSKYQMLLYNLQSIYREEGYLFVQILDKKSYRDSVVDISFEITEGLPAHIHKVLIKNNTTTKDKVLRREIKLFPGDTYRQSLMERSIRDIMQLNYFDNVMPDIKIRENQEVDLVFLAQEREAGTGQFSAGVAYSQRDNFMGTLGLSIPNCCIGDGQQASLNVEYGKQKQNYTVGFTEPWFLDRPITLGGSVNYTWYDSQYNSKEILRYGGRVFLGTRLTWPDDYFYIQGDLSWQMNQQGENDENSALLKSGSESAVGMTLTRDDKNLPRFPTEGSRYSVSVEKVFQTGIISDLFDYDGEPMREFSYLKTDFTIKWWFPLGLDFALGIDNQFGIISGDVLQNRSRYQMGGMLGYQGKLRGYKPGSIGINRLGRAFVSFVSEITYPIAENTFYALAFFDAGNVYGEELYETQPGSSTALRERLITKEEIQSNSPLQDVTPQSLKKDFGFGFRIVVPMLGIIGFDFGWPLDDGEQFGGPDTSRQMQTNFVISQGF